MSAASKLGLGLWIKGNQKIYSVYLFCASPNNQRSSALLLAATNNKPPPRPAPLLVPLQPRRLSALIWLRWALMFCRNWVGKGRDCSREGGGGGRVERVMVRFHMEVILHLSLSNDRPLFVQSLSWLVQGFFLHPLPSLVADFFFSFFLAWGLLGRRAFSYILSRICFYEHQMGSLRRGTRGGWASLSVNVHYSFNGRKKRRRWFSWRGTWDQSPPHLKVIAFWLIIMLPGPLMRWNDIKSSEPIRARRRLEAVAAHHPRAPRLRRSHPSP